MNLLQLLPDAVDLGIELASDLNKHSDGGGRISPDERDRLIAKAEKLIEHLLASA